MALPSSAIGQFIIGESPIGVQAAFDYAKTVISQYANSPTIKQFVSNFHDYIDPSADLDSFFDLIWNIDTAQGYGLDVWGRIVDIERTVQVPVTGASYLGFEEAADPRATGWNQAPFYGGGQVTQNYTMLDAEYRPAILAKAMANISDGSIRGINQILLALFPLSRGTSYVQDNLDMTMTYVFNFVLTPLEVATIAQSGVLPRPAGVSSSFTQP